MDKAHKTRKLLSDNEMQEIILIFIKSKFKNY